MNPYIKILKVYLAERPIRYGYDGVDSLLELLCYCYREKNPIENAVIHYQFKMLNDTLSKLMIRENDRVIDLTVQLCTEFTNRAFSEGLRTGILLSAELAKWDE